MRLIFPHKQRNGDRLYRRVAPTELVDTVDVIDVVDEVLVGGRHPESHARHFEVIVVDVIALPFRVEGRRQRTFLAAR